MHPVPTPQPSVTPSTSPPAASDCDVLVIGGGPAGSTAAALLARQGHRVVLIEKAHHPRFHIGESLLPANVALLEELGLRDAVDRMGMRKWGIEFVSPQHQHCTYVDFADSAAWARARFEGHVRRGPRTYAWFIYRMTNPVMRELFMYPRNVLRAKEAVTGVLAGDVYGRSPLGWSLRVFKLVYNISSLVNWRLSAQARSQRRVKIQEGDGLRNHTLSADGH